MTIFLVTLIIIITLGTLPLILIWALNTLLPITIDYTPINWLASFIIICIFGSANK